MKESRRLSVYLLAAACCSALSGCDEEGRFEGGGGGGDADSDADSDSDTDSDSDSDSDSDLPTQTIVLQDGVAGYEGCVDVAVPVPEDSGFDEITPEDDMMWVRHWQWTGS